jgi:hypothetical protein
LIDGLRSNLTKAYSRYQIETAVLYGAKDEIASMEMMEALEFEISLAKVGKF